MEKLKRCPFCGARVYIKKSMACVSVNAYQIICSCGMAKTFAYKTPEEAMRAWNKRRGEYENIH